MKVVVLDGYTANPGDLNWKGLEDAGATLGIPIELTVYDRTPAEETAARAADARAVFVNKTVISREIIAACSSLAYIGELATGYNNIDTEAAAARGVTVCNVPGYSTDSVAQMVFALLLEICQRPGPHSEAVHAGRWTRNKDFAFWDYPLVELKGKTFGIAGMGAIGRAAARIAAAFGMNVVAYSRTVSEEGKRCAQYVSLNELFSLSDIISLHCPETPETRGMINKNSIVKMKDGVVLINTARGGLVVEEDLAGALESGKIYAAGLDVLSREPPPADNPLLTAPNCVLTPHIAWAPRESRQRLLTVTAANFRAFLEGKPVNTVTGR
jgi:glycerate dehydrogenase